MNKYFNTTGYCNPDWHYMVDPLRGFKKEIYHLIERKQYFVIHAPRQTGKTTLLHSLARQLNKEGKYVSTVFSVERAGYRSITMEEANKNMISSVFTACRNFLEEKYFSPPPGKYKEQSLHDYLRDWSSSINKPIVLLLDEIDALYNDVLVSILRQLRDGFQSRPNNFPASIALVGLRDVRDYKLKVRTEDTSLGSGFPFNIKAESFSLDCFSKEMIKELYQQYTDDTGQKFSDKVIDRIYDYTGGQPWLINAIANEITYKILKNDTSKKITLKIAELAKENLILRRDTHLDSLLDKLQEERVKPIIQSIINGETVLFDNYNDSILYCKDLGIITPDNPLRFANQIYREIIPRIMNQSFQDSFGEEGETQWYIKQDGKLDMDKLLRSFQEFYRENSEHWLDRFNYKEAGQQLLLMAFLQRIINQGGRIEREMAVGRGRTDLIVHYDNKHFVLELKIKHRASAKEKGLQQLSRYLDTLGEDKGYLILFEPQKSDKVSWEERIKWKNVKTDYQGNKKNITIVEM